MKETKITGGEYGALIFVSSLSFLGTATDNMLGNNYSDAILAAVLSAILNWLFILPLLINRNKIPSSAGLSKLIPVVYIIFFVYTVAWDISSAAYMMRNTVFEDLSSWLFCGLSVAAAFYCAYLGTNTVGRSAQVIMIVLAVCGFMILSASVKHIEYNDIKVPFFDGLGGFSRALTGILSKTMLLPQCYILLSSVDVQRGKSLVASVSAAVLISGLVSTVMILLVLLCLGAFAVTQEFPIFTLASFLDLAPLQRLDIFLGIAMLTTTLVRTSLNICVINQTVHQLTDKKVTLWVVLLCVLTAATAAWTSAEPGLQDIIYSPILVIVLGLILGLMLPYILSRRKGKA